MRVQNSLLAWVGVISLLSIISILTLHFFVISASSVYIEESGLQDMCQQRELQQYGFETPTCQKNIDLNLVVSGGVSKNAIPAINNPQFVAYEQSTTPDNARGILININNAQRFYPYNILVLHEIINDNIGDTHYAVTFCPLCDSGIVMDRKIHNAILEFRVSGLLYQSNLLMYDTKTESLWSQARQKAIVGPYAGTKLDILPFQLLEFSEVKQKYPNGVVLSTDTGYYSEDSYQSTPYAGYLTNPDILFPVSVRDNRFPAKELFYIIPFNEKSVAVQYYALKQGSTIFSVENKELTITRENGEISAIHNNKVYPGYFELWFSWATHHQKDGVVLNAPK